MRKNWVDLVYWCAQLRDKDTAVCMAIQKIEKNHPTSVVIDQQSFKDHAAGTRAQDAPRILRWLESNGEEYTRTKFHKFLDGLVMFKLCTFHFTRRFLPRASFPSLIPPEFPNFQMICINVKTGFHMLLM